MTTLILTAALIGIAYKIQANRLDRKARRIELEANERAAELRARVEADILFIARNGR